MKSLIVTEDATPGAIGLGTFSVLTKDRNRILAGAGFRFALRYWRQTNDDLTREEARNVLQSGLALMVAFRPPAISESPDKDAGEAGGKFTAGKAIQVGVPPSALIWLDLAESGAQLDPQEAKAYAEAWADEIGKAGYLPGLFVHSGGTFDSETLDSLPFKHFWRAATGSPAYPAQGFCMLQSKNAGYVSDGVAYDRNLVQADHLANLPLWLSTRRRTPWGARLKGLGIAALAVTALGAAYEVGLHNAIESHSIERPTAMKPVAPVTKPKMSSEPVVHRPSVLPPVKKEAEAPPLTKPVDPEVKPPVNALPAGTETEATEQVVVAATYRQRAQALSLIRSLEKEGVGNVTYRRRSTKRGVSFSVHVGPFANEKEAETAAEILRTKYRLTPTVVPVHPQAPKVLPQ